MEDHFDARRVELVGEAGREWASQVNAVGLDEVEDAGVAQPVVPEGVNMNRVCDKGWQGCARGL